MTYRMFSKELVGSSRSVDAVDLLPCKLRKRRSFRFTTWFYRDFKSYSRSKEETDVWRSGSLLFCLDQLRGSSHDRKRIQVWCLLCGQNWKRIQTRGKSLLVRPETTANSRSAIRILYLSRTWAGTDTRSKWRPSIVQVAHSRYHQKPLLRCFEVSSFAGNFEGSFPLYLYVDWFTHRSETKSWTQMAAWIWKLLVNLAHLRQCFHRARHPCARPQSQ